MKTEKLNEAISLVRSGKIEDARQILFEYIRNDPENEVAWIWLAETLTSNQDRMKIYQACLDLNPDSKIVNMAISKLKSTSNEDFPIKRRIKPFSEDGTFDPSARERTGHTGALIGQDGSFILTDVADFSEVIDLRSPENDILNERLASTVISESVPNKVIRDNDVNPTKELDFEPDLSELLEDEIFIDNSLTNVSGSEKVKTAGVKPPIDIEAQEEIAAKLNQKLSNADSEPNLNEAETTPLNKNMSESVTINETDTVFTPSLADTFLKDDQTGDLAAPDEAFSYDFMNNNVAELDFEPDLTSFLADEKVDLNQSTFSPRSISSPLEESEDHIDLEDVPLQEELSLEELGFTGWSQSEKTGQEEKEEEETVAILPPVPPVEKKLADEFEFDDTAPDDGKKKKNKREIVLIGGAALLLLLSLIVISVFAFPGLLGGISGKTSTPTFAGVLLEPTADKIILPPVVTNTLPMLSNGTPDATETPTPTGTETVVVILPPSKTPSATVTVTPTGTILSTLISTRTPTRTATNKPQPANTYTPTRIYTMPPTNTPTTPAIATNTSVPPSNTPTKTLIPTITPSPTNTPIPPATDTPIPPPTDTPVPPPTDTPVPAPTST